MREATRQEKTKIEQVSLRGKNKPPSLWDKLFVYTFIYGSLLLFGILIWNFIGLSS